MEKKEFVIGSSTTQMLLRTLFETEVGSAQLITLQEAYGIKGPVSIKATFTISEGAPNEAPVETAAETEDLEPATA
jgi:hypothetical protein